MDLHLMLKLNHAMKIELNGIYEQILLLIKKKVQFIFSSYIPKLKYIFDDIALIIEIHIHITKI